MSDSLSKNILEFIQGKLSENELKAKLQHRKSNQPLQSQAHTKPDRWNHNRN